MEAAAQVGRSPATVRRWIRDGRLPARTEHGRRVVAPSDLDAIRAELYPILPMPDEWQSMDNGSPALNWVAELALTRSGH